MLIRESPPLNGHLSLGLNSQSAVSGGGNSTPLTIWLLSRPVPGCLRSFSSLWELPYTLEASKTCVREFICCLISAKNTQRFKFESDHGDLWPDGVMYKNSSWWQIATALYKLSARLWNTTKRNIFTLTTGRMSKIPKIPVKRVQSFMGAKLTISISKAGTVKISANKQEDITPLAF